MDDENSKNDAILYLEKWARQRNTLENQIPYIEVCDKFKSFSKLKEAIKNIRLDVRAYDTLTKEFLVFMCNQEVDRANDDDQATLSYKQLQDEWFQSFFADQCSQYNYLYIGALKYVGQYNDDRGRIKNPKERKALLRKLFKDWAKEIPADKMDKRNKYKKLHEKKEILNAEKKPSKCTIF